MRPKVAVDQTLGVLALDAQALAHVGVAQHRERHFVELEVAGAARGEVGDLLAIDGDQIGEELLGVGIGARVDPGGAAPEVHRRRRRQRDLRRAPRRAREEVELGARDRAAPRQPAGGVRRQERLLGAGLVAEREARGLGGHAVDAIDEARPVRGAAELAVGDRFEPGLLLQRHRVADGAVLDRLELVVGETVLAPGAVRLAQLGRAQQAADVIGAERRAGIGPGHGPMLPQLTQCPKRSGYCATMPLVSVSASARMCSFTRS